MFDWDDILILGDSFVGSRTEQLDWPQLVACQLTNSVYEINRQPRGQGFNGCSWWSVRTRLYEELKYKKPKVLILTHTEPQRIPSEDNYNLNPGSVHTIEWTPESLRKKYGDAASNPIVSRAPKEVLVAGQQYYKYLISYRYHLWAQEKWYEELDKLADEHDIKYVIHLHCFDAWEGVEKLYEFKNGTTFNKPLWSLSDDKKKWSVDHRNHFTVDNNKKLADIVVGAINNYKIGYAELNL